MRRTVMRGLMFVGVGTMGLTGTGPPAGAATPSPGAEAPALSPASPSPSSSSSSPSRTGSPTASPTHTRIRLHTAIIGARTTGAEGTRARYTLRVRATGGVAHDVVATIKVRPRSARFAAPRACHGAAHIRCRLGDVHRARTLHFRERAGHARPGKRRLTIAVTVRAADASAEKSTMVLVLRTAPPRTAPPRTVRQYAPRYAPPATIIRPRLTTVIDPPEQYAAPPPTMFPPPDAAEAPMAQTMRREGAAPGAPHKPRLPVIAPRPGPRPTPNGAPVTVRPVANGHPITGDASGMPTRTILGLLAAAASFVGLVTALVLIRRRNEA